MRETLNFRYLRKNKTHFRCIHIYHLRGRRQETKCFLAQLLTKPHTERTISITPILQRGKTEGQGSSVSGPRSQN